MGDWDSRRRVMILKTAGEVRGRAFKPMIETETSRSLSCD